MAKVLVFAEQRNGKVKGASFEMVAGFAKGGHEVHVALLGDSVNSLAQDFGHFGAQKVHVIEDSGLKFYNASSYAPALTQLAQALSVEWVVAANTPMSKDLMPHVAAKLGAGLASDCTSVSFENGITAKKPVYAGKAIATVEFLGSGPHCLTVRPNSFGAPQADDGKKAEVLSAKAATAPGKSKTTEIQQGALTRPDVTEASIVVSGGRALKNADNFKILEELADVIGAGVGASRAAVDAGYRPHRDQVGQTGKVVSPTLYMAFGISGAIQHLAGMRTSKTIVAINTDPEAPIFQLADYGVVADLFNFVPLLKSELQKLKDSQ